MPLAELKALTPPAVHRKLTAALKKGAAAAKRGEPSRPAALPSLAEQAAAAAAKKAKRRRLGDSSPALPPPSLAGASCGGPSAGGPVEGGGPCKARPAAVTAAAAPTTVQATRVVAGKEWAPGDALSVGNFCSFVQAMLYTLFWGSILTELSHALRTLLRQNTPHEVRAVQRLHTALRRAVPLGLALLALWVMLGTQPEPEP